MWSTQMEAIAALRTQVQDGGAPQRYTDAELGEALGRAVADAGAARPLIALVFATVDATQTIRLDDKIGAATFGVVVSVLDTTDLGHPRGIFSWQYYERDGQHLIAVPSLAAGTTVTVTVRGGYGWGLPLPGAATLDTNIPAAWRAALLDGAQGYALDLYGAREVGRTNVAPAVAQQTARAASVKLREFRQWLAGLPQTNEQHAEVGWGLRAADRRGGAHRGFD